jgi:hypothetical protein
MDYINNYQFSSSFINGGGIPVKSLIDPLLLSNALHNEYNIGGAIPMDDSRLEPRLESRLTNISHLSIPGGLVYTPTVLNSLNMYTCEPPQKIEDIGVVDNFDMFLDLIQVENKKSKRISQKNKRRIVRKTKKMVNSD